MHIKAAPDANANEDVGGDANDAEPAPQEAGNN